MMNQLKMLMLFKLLIPVIYLKKDDYKTKLSELEKKILGQNHDKYITQDINKLTGQNFAVRSAQARLATETGIVIQQKRQVLIINLKKLNKKVTSNKTKHVEAEKKLTDLTNKSCTNIRKKI